MQAIFFEIHEGIACAFFSVAGHQGLRIRDSEMEEEVMACGY